MTAHTRSVLEPFGPGLLTEAAITKCREAFHEVPRSFPRFFGTAHIGFIRGLVMAISFGSTAFGPVLFALVHDATGSYNYALLGTAALPLLVAVAASFTHAPAISGAGAPTHPRYRVPRTYSPYPRTCHDFDPPSVARHTLRRGKVDNSNHRHNRKLTVNTRFHPAQPNSDAVPTTAVSVAR